MQSETIYFYSKHPQHHGTFPDANIVHTERNRVCGDDIIVSMLVVGNTIQKWSFDGNTSLITLACSGLFGDMVQGVDFETLMTWDQDIIIERTGVQVSPRRKRAQVLALLATRNAIHTYLNDGKKDDFSDVLTDL